MAWSNNTSSNGGAGVQVNTYATFNFQGGSIINNTCSNSSGAGGIGKASTGTYNYTSGTLSGNNPSNYNEY